MPAEENKAVFRRYVEEVGNEGKLELADEIFDRYLAHQPDVGAGPLIGGVRGLNALRRVCHPAGP